MKYAVEWTVANGRGPINRYDRHGHGFDLAQAKEFLRRVVARADHVTGRAFFGKIVVHQAAHA